MIFNILFIIFITGCIYLFLSPNEEERKILNEVKLEEELKNNTYFQNLKFQYNYVDVEGDDLDKLRLNFKNKLDKYDKRSRLNLDYSYYEYFNKSIKEVTDEYVLIKRKEKIEKLHNKISLK
jgi:hypothetical protein